MVAFEREEIECTDEEESNNMIRIFWSKNDDTCSDDVLVKKNLITAFSRIDASRLKGLLIQFWAPVKPGLLSTSHQPFALSAHTHSGVETYRLSSINSPFSINNGSLHANAFLNHFPNILVNLSLHKGTNPLLDQAIRSGFTCLISLPVFDDNDSTRSCVGVVECCMNPSGLLYVFSMLQVELERVGLSTYSIQQECLPYQIVHRASEIKDALKIICESLHLTLAQVWILPPPATHNNETFLVKLCGYRLDSSYDTNTDIKYYYDSCDMLPLKFGDGLPGSAFQAIQLRFCTNLSYIPLHRCYGILPSLSANTKSTSLVLCLTNPQTGHHVYAFEFLWPKTRNFLIVLESLLLKLHKCLPTFKLAASGSQLTDDLRVKPLQTNPTTPFSPSFVIQTPRVKLGKRPSKTTKQEEWQRPMIVKKRTFSDFSPPAAAPQTYTDYWAYDADDDVFGIADYAGTTTLFTQRSASSTYTLAHLMDKVEQKFNLDPGTYTMEFQLEKDGNSKKYQLNTQHDLSHCIKLWLAFRKKSRPFYVSVLPSTSG